MSEESLGSTEAHGVGKGRGEWYSSSRFDRSCTWPIYILSHFIYVPTWLTHWRIEISVLHDLLQAPGSLLSKLLAAE